MGAEGGPLYLLAVWRSPAAVRLAHFRDFHFFKFGVKIADLPGGIGEKTLAVLQIAYSRDFPLMISAVVFALGWWFVTWWRPPVRTIARPVRDITQAT